MQKKSMNLDKAFYCFKHFVSSFQECNMKFHRKFFYLRLGSLNARMFYGIQESLKVKFMRMISSCASSNIAE